MEPLDEEDNLEQPDYERTEKVHVPMWKMSIVDLQICISDIIVGYGLKIDMYTFDLTTSDIIVGYGLNY